MKSNSRICPPQSLVKVIVPRRLSDTKPSTHNISLFLHLACYQNLYATHVIQIISMHYMSICQTNKSRVFFVYPRSTLTILWPLCWCIFYAFILIQSTYGLHQHDIDLDEDSLCLVEGNSKLFLNLHLWVSKIC